jgi:hypothetical protein
MKYNSQVPPPALFPFYPQNSYLLFNAESLTTGEFSQQVAIPPNIEGGATTGIRLQVDFSAAPGAFEIDIMECDTDTQGAAEYAQVPVAGSITVVNANSTTQATVDLLPFQGQFLCLYVRTQPANAVTCTVRATRR